LGNLQLRKNLQLESNLQLQGMGEVALGGDKKEFSMGRPSVEKGGVLCKFLLFSVTSLPHHLSEIQPVSQ
jgi:hypothetical protein